MKMTDDAVCLQVSANLSTFCLSICGSIPTHDILWLLQILIALFQYKSDAAADVKKMEKFVNNLMR